MSFYFFFRFVACLRFRFSFLVLCFFIFAKGRFLFSGMFVCVEIKSRGRGLCGVILFVVCAGGGGHIERPMAWCISLIPKKLKNENPKNKILKKKKFGNHTCFLKAEVFAYCVFMFI